MTDHMHEDLQFDGVLGEALAETVRPVEPSPGVKSRLMSRIAEIAAVPAGFNFAFDADPNWRPHPVPGIRMKVLAVNHSTGYATLLLDVAAGVRFPAHHHTGDEQCYVVAGSVQTLGRRLGPGDFLQAEAGTDHGELWTEEGARVLLVASHADVPL